MSASTRYSSARTYQLWLTILVVAGIVLEIIVTFNREGTVFDNSFVRALNLFVYFTIFSNILVAATSYRIYKNGNRPLNTTSHIAHIASIICITTTLVIHRLFLAGPLTGLPLLSDLIIHLIVPILACIGWIFFSTHKTISPRTGLFALIYPTMWLTATFLRGVSTDWYPYTFLDPQQNTLPKILLTIAQIYLLFFVILATLVLVSKYKLKNNK